MNIYLIRHSAIYNPNQLCFGQSEMPLEENFTIDFDSLQEMLSNVISNDAVYFSSDYRRCTKLANYLSNGDYQTDKRLNELNFGNWEMQPWANINPKEVKLWKEDFVNYRMPKGENFTELYERATDFYEDLINQGHENAVVVANAGVIRAIIAYILDFPLENAFNLQIDYSSISKVTFNKDKNWSRLIYLNLSAKHFKTVDKIVEED